MTALHHVQHFDDGLARLSLQSGSGNPISPGLLDELIATLERLEEDAPRALVLDASGSRIFSAGFDLVTIADWDRPAIAEFFSRFCRVLDLLLCLPCPVIAAVGGHAIAGGFILSLAADLRIVKDQPIKLGLSEVDLGVAVPAGTQVLLAARTSPATALRLAFSGALMDADEAVSVGYALEKAEDPVGRAIGIARQWAKKPGDGVAVSRMLTSKSLATAVRDADVRGLAPFLDTWFSTAAQEEIRALAQRLQR